MEFWSDLQNQLNISFDQFQRVRWLVVQFLPLLQEAVPGGGGGTTSLRDEPGDEDQGGSSRPQVQATVHYSFNEFHVGPMKADHPHRQQCNFVVH